MTERHSMEPVCASSAITLESLGDIATYRRAPLHSMPVDGYRLICYIVREKSTRVREIDYRASGDRVCRFTAGTV